MSYLLAFPFRGMLSLIVVILAGCSSGGDSSSGGSPGSTPEIGTPTITSTAALNGAQIVTLSDSTSGASIYYTFDGSMPTVSSAQYIAPFLMASNATLKAIAFAGNTSSQVASQSFAPNIATGTLVWSDEFANPSGGNAEPDPKVWTYDTGNSGFGNDELENYCAWSSTTSPCDTNNPNAYVGTDGYLHIVARHPSNGVYTSARLKTQGLFSFSYGRIEARMQLPEGQGFWPAFWLLGNNITTVNWPACGEQDVMEHINAPQPDWIAGSLHGTNVNLTQQFPGSTGQSFRATDWHIYGMIWLRGSVEYYVDSPSNVYATYTPASVAGQSGAVWPFDSESGEFVILNFAVGGNWPGSPDTSTTFPSEVLVDYVRIYTN